jgi:hypothetical protein
VWPASPFGGDSQPTQLQRAVSPDQAAPGTSESPPSPPDQPAGEPAPKSGDNTVLMAAPATGEKSDPEPVTPDAKRFGFRRTSPSR